MQTEPRTGNATVITLNSDRTRLKHKGNELKLFFQGTLAGSLTSGNAYELLTFASDLSPSENVYCIFCKV